MRSKRLSIGGDRVTSGRCVVPLPSSPFRMVLGAVFGSESNLPNLAIVPAFSRALPEA